MFNIGNYSEAMAVNGERIVGNWGNSAVGPIHGFVWQAGVMTDLGSTLGAHGSRAADVTGTGTVVGWLRQNAGDERIAYVLEEGNVTILGPIPGGFSSEALAINGSTGQVVGWGRRLDEKTGDLLARAFLWDDGDMIDLGSLPGFQWSAAIDVNDAGIVVGRLYGGAAGGLIWDDGIMMDLNDLIPADADVHVVLAWAINNQGQIACNGISTNGDGVGLLLTPVGPTPGDLTCDGHVLLDDFTLLLDAWGPCPADDVCPADLDGDGSVGIVDFLMLLANWG